MKHETRNNFFLMGLTVILLNKLTTFLISLTTFLISLTFF